MEVGSAVHKGLEQWINCPEIETVGTIIDEAVASYEREMADQTDYPDSIDEGKGMIEAMIALFIFHPFGWEKMNDEYDIIETEREISLKLSDDLIFNSRPDLIVKEKATGNHYTIDLKTAAMIEDRSLKAMAIDFQSIIQPFAVEQDLGVPVLGEIRWNMIKGRNEAIKDSFGNTTGWQSASYLHRPYAVMDENGLTLSYGSWNYCNEPHKMGRGNCEGKKRHKRGDEWTRISLWKLADQGAPRIWEWVKMVCEQIANDPLHPEQNDVLKLIHVTQPIIHSDEVRENLIDQVIAVEHDLHRGQSEYVNDDLPKMFGLNRNFPQNRSACVYPYACTFNSICNGSTDIEQQLIDLGSRALGLGIGFMKREPNHDETFED
jgi:PD-(D/E)XK nuclease superfamily